MFNASLERVLNVAAREAMVRRHADLTVEHLLFAAAHDPEGEEILEAAGADVPRLRHELAEFLEQTMQKLPPARAGRRSRRSPSGGCCRPPSCTCRAPARTRRESGTCWRR